MNAGWWTAADAARARSQDGIDLPPCIFCGHPFDGSDLSVLVWDGVWAHEGCHRQQEVGA